MTHMATAHNDLSVLRQQLSSFQDTVDIFKEKYGPLQFHAANSAATIRSPESHFDMVRCGIALYGCDPLNTDPALRNLEPALELSSYVAALKVIQRGDAVGYSQRFVADYATWVATIPIGYADGVRRDLANNGEVLIEGCRYPIVGTVSMDNITVELGPGADAPVALGTHAVLIGRSGDDLLTAESIANRAGTISNEILCAISSRVLRTYHRDGQPA
jgi:alanine racemase